MKGPTPRRLKKYVAKCLGLKSYLQSPGDGRTQGRIPAAALLWALLMGVVLRCAAFAGIEALVRSRGRRALNVSQRFGDDALSYFTARLKPAVTRRATIAAVRQAKRHKAFDDCRFIGLALDGTGAGRSRQKLCKLCRPYRNKQREILGYHHKLAMISVVGTGLTLPLDVEPYGPGDSEYNAARRLLRRTIENTGRRFADYVVADGEFARAPFLHDANDLGLFAVVRLKNNLPELFAAAQKRFACQPPHQVFQHGKDRVEIWDADDFDPWQTLRWETVRVIRYRQYQPNGEVCEAYWLTDFPRSQVGSRALFRMAKSRWEIENQGFNDAKNRYGFEHICHHERHSLLAVWLLTCLALTIERLYRVRYLHRGTHPVRAAIDLFRLLQLSLAPPASTRTDSS
ncbi:MAG TPA: transposase [Candidatus Acidoferrales bacterium]|nr:transposase [Candidatus Acidoferrales bacterium]